MKLCGSLVVALVNGQTHFNFWRKKSRLDKKNRRDFLNATSF